MDLFVTLTPSESKRLIGKAVAEMPLVKERLKKGKIAISVGSTTGLVAEEILQTKLDVGNFISGLTINGRQCRTPGAKIGTIFIENGTRIDRSMITPENEYEDAKKYFAGLGKDDLYIKSANAVDVDGNAGFVIGHPEGGNVLLIAGPSATRRTPIIVPVGLEKLVPSVIKAAKAVRGLDGYDYSFGRGCGYHVISNATVVTEIEAIDILCGAKAVHVASGGISGSEGSVLLTVEGSKDQIEKLFKILKGVKGEKPIESWKMDCKNCAKMCNYPEGAKK